MSEADSFATAWIWQGHQILVYEWEDDEDLWHVHHLMRAEGINYSWTLHFDTYGRAHAHLLQARVIDGEWRQKIEEFFQILMSKTWSNETEIPYLTGEENAD